MLAVNILTSPIAGLLVGYVLFMIVLAVVVQPMRLQLVRTVDELLADPRLSDAHRARLYTLRDHSMSFAVGLLVPVAVISVMADDLLGRQTRDEDDVLTRDPRYAQCVWRFFASLAAANPLAAIISIALMGISILVGLAFRRKPAREVVDEAVEAPTLRALGRFHPAF